MQARARGFMIVPVVSSVISSPPVVDPVVDNARDVARLDAVSAIQVGEKPKL